MFDDPPAAPTDRQEALLLRLRELAHKRDPVPECVTAAAQSALIARKGGGRGPDNTENELGRGSPGGTPRNADRFS